MPIFHAIGLGILIIMLRFLAPAVLTEGEQTVIAFLHGATVSANTATGLAASAAGATNSRSKLPSALPDYPLPQARQITSP